MNDVVAINYNVQPAQTFASAEPPPVETHLPQEIEPPSQTAESSTTSTCVDTYA